MENPKSSLRPNEINNNQNRVRPRPQSFIQSPPQERRHIRTGSEAPAMWRARPQTMVLSSPSHSHIPSTLFPDVPSSRNSTYRAQPIPAVASPGSSGLSPYSRSDSSRRQTVHVPTSPRRESRPLRSSPLAGPAVSHDGTVTRNEGDSDENNKPRYRPNRISSSPDVTSLTGSLTSLSISSASAPGSPTGTMRGNPPPPQPLDLPGYATKIAQESPSAPEPAVATKRANRLSLGLKALTSLPGLPSLPLKTGNTDTEGPHARRHSEGERHSKHTTSSENIPAVPTIPVWARPSIPPSTIASSSQNLKPEAPKPMRRPSTAPSVSSKRSVRSLHSLASTPSTSSLSSQFSEHSRTVPSTSRNPELNWMTAAATPKFSRLSLKAEGVVLPVSAKAARRKSTVSILSLVPEDPDAERVKAQQKDKARTFGMKRPPSLKSLASATTSGELLDGIETPVPPFRSASASTSSVASTASESDMVRTPSLSLSRTTSPASSLDEFGVSKEGQDENGHGGVELRVNDVTVEIIGVRTQKENVQAKAAAVTVTVQQTGARALKAGKEGKPERRGTLKRIWRRMIGSVRS